MKDKYRDHKGFGCEDDYACQPYSIMFTVMDPRTQIFFLAV